MDLAMAIMADKIMASDGEASEVVVSVVPIGTTKSTTPLSKSEFSESVPVAPYSFAI